MSHLFRADLIDELITHCLTCSWCFVNATSDDESEGDWISFDLPSSIGPLRRHDHSSGIGHLELSFLCG